jgi:hypothetical protein
MRVRRLLNRLSYPVGFVLAGAAALWEFPRARTAYPRLDYLTGWLLMAAVLFLTAYNGRKKIAFLPLASSRVWLRVHAWLGMLTGLVFFLHTRWRVPSSPFELALAALFVAVTLSGLVGWGLSRILPGRLTTAGGEVPYERIPVIRRVLRERAQELVLEVVPTAGTTTLADFYAARLSPFFSGPKGFASHLFGSARTLKGLLTDIDQLKRHLGDHEKSAAIELAALVREKDALDLHRSVQLVLKGWLFVHIPLTYGMLAFAAVHVVLVYSFAGGAR